jgi:hypothetical protein
VPERTVTALVVPPFATEATRPRTSMPQPSRVTRSLPAFSPCETIVAEPPMTTPGSVLLVERIVIVPPAELLEPPFMTSPV